MYRVYRGAVPYDTETVAKASKPLSCVSEWENTCIPPPAPVMKPLLRFTSRRDGGRVI